MKKNCSISLLALCATVLILCARYPLDNPHDPNYEGAIPDAPWAFSLSAGGEKPVITGSFSCSFTNAEGVVYARLPHDSVENNLAFVPVDTLFDGTSFTDSADLDYWTRYDYVLYTYNQNHTAYHPETLSVRTARAPDITGPEITLVFPAEDSIIWGDTLITVSFIASDISRIKHATVNSVPAVFDSILGLYSAAVALDDTGAQTLNIAVSDSSQNANTGTAERTVWVNLSYWDHRAPVLTIANYEELDSTDTDTVMLSGTVFDENGIRSFSLILNETQLMKPSFTDSTWLDTIPLQPGSNRLIFLATDGSYHQNWRADTLTIIKFTDTQGPLIQYSALQSGDTVGVDTVLLQGFARDVNGVAGVTVNGGSAAVLFDRGRTLWWSRAVPVFPGQNSIVVTAQDSSKNGNIAADTIRVFNDTSLTDSGPPVLTLISISDTLPVIQNHVWISGLADDISGIWKVIINGDSLPGASNFSYNLTGLSEGYNTIEIELIDNSTAKNSITDTVIVYFWDDTQGPALSVDSSSQYFWTAADSLYTEKSAVHIHGTAYDVSRIHSITINSAAAEITFPITGNRQQAEWAADLSVPFQNMWYPAEIAATDRDSSENDSTFTYYILSNPTVFDRNHVGGLTISSHANGISVFSDRIDLEGTVFDSSGIRSLRVNGMIADVNMGDSSWSMYNFPVDTSYVGAPTTIRVIGTDNSYWANRDTVEITVYYKAVGSQYNDVTAPTITYRHDYSEANDVITVTDSTHCRFRLEGTVTDDAAPPEFRINGRALTVTGSAWSYDTVLTAYTNRLVLEAVDISIAENTTRETLTVYYDYKNNGAAVIAKDTADGDITIRWNRNTDPDFAEFAVWLIQGVSYDAEGTPDRISTDTSFTFTPADRYEWYTVFIGVRDSAGNDLAVRKAVRYAGYVPLNQSMIFIDAKNRSFSMGQSGIAEPVHLVQFTYNFWMDSTEITQHQYQALMNVNPSEFSGSFLPVENVTWYDAALFCNARSQAEGLDTVYAYTSVTGTRGNGCVLNECAAHLDRDGFRLPTEAEWEYTCRAGSLTDYYWGNRIDGDYLWYDFNSDFSTRAVAQKKPNDYGFYDMSGNVSEWCNDFYGYYTTGMQTDPEGTGVSLTRVSRGGGWYLEDDDKHKSAYRSPRAPETQFDNVGFRTVFPAR